MTGTRRSFLERALGASAALSLPVGPLGERRRPLAWPSGSLDDEDFWTDLKRQFVFPPTQLPMNSANMCPAPLVVVQAVERATREVDSDVSYQNRAKYNELRETVRGKVAAMLGVTADEIAIVRNASEANNIVVGGIPLGAGDEVVLLDQNHQTNNVAWDVRAARFGFTVKRVSFEATPERVDEVVRKMTAPITERTRVLAFSDVSNSTGLAMPIAELARIGRARGIHVHVDGAQTFGAAVRNLATIGCDSYSASAQKWLMGPREIGILYVRADRIAPMWPGVVGVGWGTGPEPSAKGARKFETLGQRNDASTAGLAAALEFHERLGAAKVEARVRQLGERLFSELDRAGFDMVTPKNSALRLGVVVVKADGAKAQQWHERLYRSHSVIGSNTGGLRLSPHVCNTLADIDQAVVALKRVVS